MKDPEPAGGPSTDPQEPTKDLQEDPAIGALAVVTPESPSSLTSLAMYISAIQQGGVNWKIDGSFSVDGILRTTEACCVTGEPDSLEFEDATGITLGLVGKRFELALVAYQQVEGRSHTRISSCIPSTPDLVEDATIDVTMEWQFTLLGRVAVLDLDYGIVGIQLGLEVGGSATQIELEDGMSSSATFKVDETMNTLGMHFGPFLSFSASIGGLRCRSVASVRLGSFGEGYTSESTYSLSLGMGVDF
ncbi:MAG TPA: hypothetical protein VJU16_07520 [Planctomycetota bacterium]|nr:hypothetical protein [Planctomycetota bacterium]